jgi:hypothetical protein
LAALHIATRDLRMPIIQLLLDYGAIMVTKNQNYDTPLADCFHNHNIDKLDSAIAKQMVMAADDADGNCQFHAYATSKTPSDEYLCYLLQRGLSMELKNKQGKTAPLVAFECYQTLRATYLYKKNPEIKEMMKTQEAIVHTFLPYCFLPVATEHSVCQAYKDIFERFGVIKEIQRNIMEYYYRKTCAEIAAGNRKEKIA